MIPGMDTDTSPHSINKAKYAENSALVERIRCGDIVAVEQFFHEFKNLIYHVIQKYHQIQYQDHEDLLHSFFAHLAEDNYRRIIKWNKKSLLSTYIVTILKNFLNDILRNKTSKILSGGIPIDELPEDTFDDGGIPDITEEILSIQLRKHIKVCKYRLKDRDREIICNRYYKELTIGETAEKLGLIKNAYYVAESRAVTKLIQCMRKLYPELFSDSW